MSLDLFDLPNTSYKTQVFYSSGTWVKPRGISIIEIVAIGAGGGGGGGLSKTSTLVGAGGGGGGSGAISKLIIPAIFVTDSLVVRVGVGGSGGAGGNGTAGNAGATGVVGGQSSVDLGLGFSG